jgi:hypothetical protein
MKHVARVTTAILIIIGVLITPVVFAADTAIATFNVSGTVPTFFSVTARGMPGDLDLTPNVTVNNRRLGLLHFKYNMSMASLTISSSTASGGPEALSGAVYNFQGSGFGVSVDAACTSVDATYNTPFTLSNAGTDIKSALAAALVTNGIEEDCEVYGSWQGTNASLPLAGVYAMSVLVTMVSL